MTKRLTRTPDDKWIGGVCGGIGRYVDVDPNLIRLATAVLAVLGFGSVIVAYVVAWVLMPKAGPTVYAPPPPVPVTQPPAGGEPANH